MGFFLLERPERNYFFPDLHHMKFEIEDGATVEGGKIRFGYDPQEFPSFSWRGYALMSSIQVSWYFTQDFGVKMKTKVHGTYVFIAVLCMWKVMEKRQKKGQDLTNLNPLALCCCLD